MKVQSILSRYSLVLMMTSIAMTGCFNEQAYRKLEDSYSRPTKQVSPMSSNVRWACESNMLFEPAKIKIIYAGMRRVTGACTKEPFSFDVGENLRNKQWATPDELGNTHLTEICKYPKIPIKDCQPTDTLKVPNTDPNKGAVNVWQVSNVSLDGVLSENKVTNLRGSERIHYAMYIVEGHKLPLGGMFRGRFSQDYMDNQNKRTVKSTFTTANGLEWEHARYNRRPKESDQTNWLYDQTEMYQADVGNYSILIYGIYNDPVYKYPDWLAKRQAFLREWVETFKIEPLPADYKKVQRVDGVSLTAVPDKY